MALDEDASVAKREILRALELLLDSVVRIPFDRPVPGLAAWQARGVVDHVLANLESPIRIDDLAAVTRLSKSHFSRAFKLSFRVSPHAYIVALRLSHARALLSDGDEQISQIAAACGFADQAHFCRVFRRSVGCAPGLWRRRRRSHLINESATPIEDPAARQALQHLRFEFAHLAGVDDVAA
ncbi:MAG: AraC family transcriptional regulator [Rhodanobacter sp.]